MRITIVGRTFFPELAVKKYCAHFASTGWDDVSKLVISALRV